MSGESKTGHELNELLERGEISPEAYAEYANSTPHTRVESAMFDHLTLRVGDLATVDAAFTAMLAELEIEQTASTPNLSVWGISRSSRRHQHTSSASGRPASTPASPTTGPPARVPITPTTTTLHSSKTPPATTSKRSTATAPGRKAALITSASASTTSKRAPPSTRRSPQPRASRSVAKRLTAPASLSADQRAFYR